MEQISFLGSPKSSLIMPDGAAVYCWQIIYHMSGDVRNSLWYSLTEGLIQGWIGLRHIIIIPTTTTNNIFGFNIIGKRSLVMQIPKNQ